MVWLILHQWILLFFAFLLGLLVGWWIWSARGQDELAGEDTAIDPAGDRAPLPLKTPLEQAVPANAVEATSSADRHQPVLYENPSQGPADDLKKISGIGPKLEDLLNRTGIYYYEQIRDWTPAEIAWIDDKLQFPGRIVRDKWQEQAAILADGGKT